MCRLRNIAMRDYQERQTDRQTPDKVIPMCRYASQATQKSFQPYRKTSLGVLCLFREKERDMTQSYDENLYTNKISITN